MENSSAVAEPKGMRVAEALPFLGMFMAESAQVSLMILSKVAVQNGLSTIAFVFYCNAFASLVLLPSSFLFHRSELPPLTLPIFCGVILLGSVGAFAQISRYVGVNYSSPTLGTVLLNLVPGFTFAFAAICRIEKVQWRSLTTAVKSIGTIVSVGGAFIVTLYKGRPLLIRSFNSSIPHNTLFLQKSDWVIGGTFLAVDSVLSAVWLVMQAFIIKKYPAELIVVFFYCFFVAVQCGMCGLVFERDLTFWSLDSSTKLIATLVSTLFGTVFRVVVCTWCLHKVGPVFVAMFKPLGIVIAALVDVIFFGDTLYLGHLIGGIVIVVGFYSVMWGKFKEGNDSDEAKTKGLESSEQKVALLQNSSEQSESVP